MELDCLGWNPACEDFFANETEKDVFPARVVFASRGHWRILGTHGESSATLTGKARNSDCPPPVVGDWVAARRLDGQTSLILYAMPRQSVLARGESGGRKRKDGAVSGEQVLAANVTASLIVCGLDRDYNPRRIERFIALSYGGGVQPFVLLNKADLCADASEKAAEIERLSPGVPVLPLSAFVPSDVERVRGLLHPGDTVCLLGTSGAGKSTLLNALSEAPVQNTLPMSTATGKGRHTTTHRELFVLPGGLIVIDTPGLREVALGAGADLEQTFPEVERLAAHCRFRDCTHEGEPDCAVAAAVERGELSGERWESFQRLQREMRHQQHAADPILAAKEKARWKMIHKSLKHHPKYSK